MTSASSALTLMNKNVIPEHRSQCLAYLPPTQN
jgi:hypothetical protein